MDDLVSRALMGDKKAQDECTEKGVLLPCPCCGGEAKLKKGFPSSQRPNYHQALVQCKKCHLRTVTHTQCAFESWQDAIKSVLSVWNTRPGLPIGRCEGCKYCDKQEHRPGVYWCNLTGSSVLPDDFCSYFE